jgi:hypothetical protein
MPQELQIIRASEFIRMGAQEHFDLEASKEALADLAAACRKRGISRAMLDLRGVQVRPKPVFSPTDLSTLVNTFHSIGFTPDQRLAVLYQSDPHERARLFAFLSSMRGWVVRAFGSFEKAMLWLAEPHEGEMAARQVIPGEKKIPVRFAKSTASPPPHPVTPPRRRGVRAANRFDALVTAAHVEHDTPRSKKHA